ncbi:MAG: hypothetical protein ACI4XH_04820 [Acutalibacteraceae bacterium]
MRISADTVKERQIMRVIRIIVSILFTVSLVLYGFVYFTNNKDTTFPRLKCDVQIIETSVKSDDAQLLSHVTAYDEKEGDLTDSVIVEKVSAFVDFGKVNVTFAVCDSDNNVSKITVPVVYTDYQNPRFKLLDDLVFQASGAANVKDCITVSDTIDGDITERLIVIDNGADITVPGRYPLTLKVTNSKSFTYTTDIDLIIVDNLEAGYSIELKEYMIYKKIGETVDYNSYIKSASVPYGKNENYDIEIDSSEVNETEAGVYNVFYYQKIDGETKTVSRLIVCNEE